MIDQTVSHYRILEKLGEGGMGEVYLAEDTSLKRQVALKFLPERLHRDALARKRFLREAESAAALEHPYICNIKEVARTDAGQDFIVMEYVKGQTLKERIAKGPLSLPEALQISAEITDALAMAHEEGIVHRDLKPANIMLTPQGHAKVMDFGLAKRLVTEEGTEQDLTAGLTREGSTMGTPAYMSPEQVKAQPVDHRSDLFSFGIILYEMLTGIHPFRRHGPVETMGAILHEEPEPLAKRVLGSSELLQKTVNRLLAKDPEERIQTVREVSSRLQKCSLQQDAPGLTVFLRSRLGRRLAVLVAAVLVVSMVGWWWFLGGFGQGPVVSSIAVLPLVNLSGDPEQEYFADGMTDALITDLSKIGALKVISRSSSMRYKGTEKSLVEIARELDVEAIIEGSVLREEDQVRITAQLIEAATERNLWAERYTRNLTSILVLQGEVAQAIAQGIQVTLTPGETGLLTGRREVDPDAYEAYLKGQFHLYKLTPADLETAHQYFNMALEKDPNYALAHFGIAFYWAAQQQMSLTSPVVAAPKVKAAVQRAYELDDMLPEVHYLMALVKTWMDWDWEAAEVSFKRAIELNPNYAHLRAYYAQYLMTLKRQVEATTQMKLALELDPLNPLVQALHGSLVCYGDRRYDEAIELTQRALQIEPNQPVAFSGLFSAFYGKGMFEEALEVQIRRVSGRGATELAEIMATGYEAGGFPEAFRRLADKSAERSRTTYVSALGIASAYTLAEDYGRAMQWLERAFEDRNPNLPYIAVKPEYDSLRDDTRFQDLLGRMNLH